MLHDELHAKVKIMHVEVERYEFDGKIKVKYCKMRPSAYLIFVIPIVPPTVKVAGVKSFVETLTHILLRW
jgi:hypothetical protein